MLPAGMLLMWAGYSVSLWGWCLLRGYDVTLGQLMSPTHPYGSGKGQPWPPKLIGPDVIWPGGRSATTAGGAAGTGQDSAVAGVQQRVGSSSAAQQRTAGGEVPGQVSGRY